MHERKAIRFLLLFSAFMILTTCQFQFNNEGKGLGIRLLVPASVSVRGKECKWRQVAGGWDRSNTDYHYSGRYTVGNLSAARHKWKQRQLLI